MFRKIIMLLMAAALPFGVTGATALPAGVNAMAGDTIEVNEYSTSLFDYAGTPAKAIEMAISSAVKANPAKAGEIVADAIRSGIAPGIAVTAAVSADTNVAKLAVIAAISVAPGAKEDISAAAILAGADPTTVTAATAAGLSAPPSPFAPAAMPNVGIGRGGVTPFGVGVVVNGGGAASPS